MSTDNRPIEQPAVKTTIVGGRPPGSGKGVGQIPRGIEILIKKAAVDPAFRELLLAQRSKAADEIGLRLEPAEALMLNAAPADQLAAVIGQTRVDPALKPALLGKVAAAMLLALGLTTVGSGVSGDLANSTAVAAAPPPAVSPPAPTGVRPDMPPSTQADTRARIDALAGLLDSRNFSVRTLAEQRLRQFDLNTVVARLKQLLAAGKLSPEAATRATAITQTPEEIDRLIGQLGRDAVPMAGVPAGEMVFGDEAARRLFDIGPWALPQLKQARDSGKLSPQAALQAAEVIRKLTAIAQATTQPAPPGPTRGIQPDRPMTKGIQPDRPSGGTFGITPDRPSASDPGDAFDILVRLLDSRDQAVRQEAQRRLDAMQRPGGKNDTPPPGTTTGIRP